MLAGPYAAMVLADLGADVVKVERPGAGDDTRAWGPPFHGGDATYFLAVNRNRRALALDLTTQDGQAVLGTLAAHADIVLENFLPPQRDSLGLDAVRAACPQSTWVAIRGVGSDGLDAGQPGYDVMAQARSGLMHVTGSPDGPPTKVGVAIADVVAGLHAAVAALAGVCARDRGAAVAPVIEVPLLESTLAALVNQAAGALVTGVDPGRLGNDHPSLAPYGPLRCADRSLVVGAGNNRQFRSLVTVLGLPYLADDARFVSNRARVAHRGELHAALEAVLMTCCAADWAARFASAGVPSSVVQTIGEALADAHVASTDLIQTVDHPAGALRLVGSPYLVDGRRLPIRSAPPAVGEHTDVILGGLGLAVSAVADLRGRGVVA